MARRRPDRSPSLEEAAAWFRQRYGRRLVPPLEGLACRFTIWLPILAQGRPVFTEPQRLILDDLFRDCFGGFSQTSVEGFPAWSGSWLPAVAVNC